MRTNFARWRWILFCGLIIKVISARLPVVTTEEKTVSADDALSALISITEEYSPSCSYIIFLDGSSYRYGALYKGLSEFGTSKGVAVLDSSTNNFSNKTHLEHLIHAARKLRLSFHCVTVIILSDDSTFVMKFAKTSLANRLLAGSSGLVVVGRLSDEELVTLSSHWVFLMQRTLIVVPGQLKDREKWQVYISLPFSASGRQLINAATWTPSRGLVLSDNITLLPDKFSDFFGASVNITALPYKPYWTKEEHPDGEGATYWGADRLMLETMSSALNFSIYVMPVESWDEVLQRVSDRTSMVASVVHMVLPQRLLRVDFTRTYEHGINIAFSMAKPVLKPQWQSLYFPLESVVWLCILGALVITPVCFIGIIKGSMGDRPKAASLYGLVVIEIVATLLGQALNPRLPAIASARILLGTWLVFAFIVATAYRSNLMASLIAPRYPPRPEELEQLVKVAKRVTMPSYGAEFRDYLRASEFESFRALGAMLDVGVSVTEGLNQALKSRQSHIDGTRYLEQQIAEHFTEANGDSRLYVGRQGVLPGLNAWPVPHDAPYKENFDAVILAVIEGGLYNKWMKDMLDQARKEGRQRRREKIQQISEQNKVEEVAVNTGSSNEARALTIVHLQGPLMIMVLGAAGAFAVFFFEVFLMYFSPMKETGVGVRT